MFKINGEWSWVSAAIDTETKLILDAALLGRHGADSAAAFLHRLDEKYDLSETTILVDQFGNRTALFRLGLSGQIDYSAQNLVEKWFYTLQMRLDRFHNSWVGSRSSVHQLIEQLVHYYQRPHQSLGRKTPVEEKFN